MWGGRAAGNFGPVCRQPQNSTFLRKNLEQNKWLSSTGSSDVSLTDQRMSPETSMLFVFGILFSEMFIPGTFNNKKTQSQIIK